MAEAALAGAAAASTAAATAALSSLAGVGLVSVYGYLGQKGLLKTPGDKQAVAVSPTGPPPTVPPPRRPAAGPIEPLAIGQRNPFHITGAPADRAYKEWFNISGQPPQYHPGPTGPAPSAPPAPTPAAPAPAPATGPTGAAPNLPAPTTGLAAFFVATPTGPTGPAPAAPVAPAPAAPAPAPVPGAGTGLEVPADSVGDTASTIPTAPSTPQAEPSEAQAAADAAAARAEADVAAAQAAAASLSAAPAPVPVVPPPEVEPVLPPTPAPIAVPPPAPAPPTPAEIAEAVAAAGAVAAGVATESQCQVRHPIIFELLKQGTYNGVPVRELSLNESQTRELLRDVGFMRQDIAGQPRDRRRIFAETLRRIRDDCRTDQNVGFESAIQNIHAWLNFFTGVRIPDGYVPPDGSEPIDGAALRRKFGLDAPAAPVAPAPAAPVAPAPAAPVAPAPAAPAPVPVVPPPEVEPVLPPTPAPAPEPVPATPVVSEEEATAAVTRAEEEARQRDQAKFNQLIEETTTPYTYETWVPYKQVRENWNRLSKYIRKKFGVSGITDEQYFGLPEKAQQLFVSTTPGIYKLMDVDAYVSHITPITPVADPEPEDTMGYMAAYRKWKTRLGDRQLTQAEYDNLGADWVKGLFKKNKKGNYELLLGKEVDKKSRDATQRVQKDSRWRTARGKIGNILGLGPAFPKPTAAAPAPTAAAAPKPGFSFPTKPWKIGVAPAPAPAAAPTPLPGIVPPGAPVRPVLPPVLPAAPSPAPPVAPPAPAPEPTADEAAAVIAQGVVPASGDRIVYNHAVVEAALRKQFGRLKITDNEYKLLSDNGKRLFVKDPRAGWRFVSISEYTDLVNWGVISTPYTRRAPTPAPAPDVIPRVTLPTLRFPTPGAGTGLPPLVTPAPAAPVAPAPAPTEEAERIRREAEETAARLNAQAAERAARSAATTIGGPLPIGTATGLPTQPVLTENRASLLGLTPSSTAGTVTAAPAAPPAAPVRVPVRGVLDKKKGTYLPASAVVVPRPPPLGLSTSPTGQFRSTSNPLFVQKHRPAADVHFENLPDQLNQEDFNRLSQADRMQYKIVAWQPGIGKTFKKRPRRLDTSGGMRKKTFKSRRQKKTNGRGTRRRKDRANRSHSNPRRRT